MNSWIERTDSTFKDMNLTTLGVDECFLNITSHIKNKIWLYALSEDCVTCPFKKLATISPHQDNILKVDTARNVQWKFFRNNLGQYAKNDEKEFCTLAPSLGEFGVYDVIVEKDGSCDYSVAKEPVNIYLPILFVLLILLALTALIKITNKFCKRHQRNAEISTREDTELYEDKPLVKPRLRSLDTFRGLTICLMIFVNSGGGHYWWIEHATWNGLHIADLVFPWFLWIMGVCIPMSVKSQLGRNTPKKDMLISVLRRSITLFLIGLFLNTANGPKLEDIRIFGVLQRFGIAYFFVTSLHIICMKPINLLPQNNRRRQFYDIIILLPQWGVMLLVIAVHLAITFSLPVPGCQTGYLGPGGNHEMGQHKNCIGGATGFIDRTILGAKHIYQWPTAKHVYASMAFDPEGVFGCLLTIVQVFFGVQCGMILTIHSKWKARITRWIIWSLCCGLIAGILCNFSKEDGWIPVNKNMWSLSYALVTSSFAFTLLSICYYFIDVKKWWDGSPFVYAGMNAIVMYVGHTVFHKMMPWHFKIGEMNTHFILLFESTWNTVLWVGIAYWLYCKDIFYSI